MCCHKGPGTLQEGPFSDYRNVLLAIADWRIAAPRLTLPYTATLTLKDHVQDLSHDPAHLGYPRTPIRHQLLFSPGRTYLHAAKDAGHEVRVLRLGDLAFDPVLHNGYSEVQALEPDLLRAQSDILWATHLTFVFPIWWGGIPALMAGI